MKGLRLRGATRKPELKVFGLVKFPKEGAIFPADLILAELKLTGETRDALPILR